MGLAGSCGFEWSPAEVGAKVGRGLVVLADVPGIFFSRNPTVDRSTL